MKKALYSNQSTEKALLIIEFLAESGAPQKLMDIAAGLNMNTSTVLRFLLTLTSCGYVTQNPETLKYRLSFKICSIANKVTNRTGIREIAGPFLRELGHALGETVCMAVEQMSYAVYIDVVESSDQMIRTMQRIGSAAPMHCTGVGKLLLTKYSDEQLRMFVVKNGLPSFTENTITTEAGLRRELQSIREHGFAYDNEECETGAKCIAVPIKDYSSTVVAAVSVTGPIYRFTKEATDGFLPKLLETALRISRELGFVEEKI